MLDPQLLSGLLTHENLLSNALTLKNFMLPPKRPQLNGAVERCNGAWRYEFYAVHDLPHQIDKLQPFVDAFAHRCNHHRPHDALDGQTPAEYLKTFSAGAPPRLMCPEPGQCLEATRQ